MTADRKYPPFVHVIGRAGKDAEVKEVKDSEIVKFSVAMMTGFGDGDTEWFDVDVWSDNKSFEAAKSVRKGYLVGIIGKPRSRDYNGKTYVTLDPVRLYRAVDIEAEEDTNAF